MRLTRLIGWAAAGAAVLGLRREHEQLALVTASSEHQLADAARERDRLQDELERTKDALRRREAHIERLGRARRAERGFTLELREQLDRVRRGHGAHNDHEDVRELVLRAAIKLVGAEKGLLLSRDDEDRDGDLDLVATEGFDADPEHGAIVQRFASRVLERDQIVREDSPRHAADGSSAADDEIENLVAIPLYLRDEFDGVVICANREGGFADVDDDLLLALGDHTGSALQSGRLRQDLDGAHRATLRALAEALESRHPLLAREAGVVAMLARRLARHLDVPAAEQETIASAAMVRDVGYLGVPDRILLKPGPLLAQERAVMEMHPRVGHALISKVPALEPIASTVLAHHERWDGSGYPHGLSGEAIPRAARLLAVVDAFVAMTHERPYRPARTAQEALDEIMVGAGREFDPEIATALSEELAGDEAGLDPGVATAVATALEGGGPASLADEVPLSDPLTLMAGHRAFHEDAEAAARDAADAGARVVIALVRLEDLETINHQAGYAAGDEAIMTVARGVQRAAARCGGTAYRESGRRFAVLVEAPADVELRDPLHELQLELATVDALSLACVDCAPGDRMADVVARARAELDA